MATTEALYNLFFLLTFIVLVAGSVYLFRTSILWRTNRWTVVRKVRASWPDQAELALAELDRYNSQGIGRARVQLAVLKMSQGSLNELKRWVEIANTDWRDPLLIAEYPEAAEHSSTSGPVPAKVRERDRQRYVEWLRE
jgi:hypothetical protein